MSTRAPRKPTTNGPVRAAVYTRISRDDNGTALGVKRQEKDCRLLCERKGWDVAHVYVDDDASAWTGKRRPEYENLLVDLAAGALDAVAVYDLDRLHRIPAELENFFSVCDEAGVAHLASVAGDVDLGSTDGRLVARIMGAVAKKASDDTSRRRRRKNDELAEAGLPAGGPRAFGWVDATTPDPAEAAVVRELVARLTAGESATSLASDLNSRGVRTTQRGKAWGQAQVRCVATNPRHAALRVHRGEVVGPAAWPALVTRAEHEAVVAALGDPARRQTHTSRRGLLTGLVRCGTCGAPLHASGEQLRCSAPARHTAVSRRHVEELVVEGVFHALDTGQLAEAVKAAPARDDDGAAAELADAEGRLGALAAMFAAAEIDRGEWLRARKGLDARRDAARAALSRRRRTAAVDAYAGEEGALRGAWPALSLDRRRAVLAAVVDRVEVSRGRRGAAFDPGRVTTVWRA